MNRWRALVLIGLFATVGVPLTVPFLELFRWQGGLVLGQDRLLVLAGNTFLLVCGTLLLSLPLGVVAAVLLYRTDLPLAGLFRFLTVLTLFVPLPVVTTAWQAALGSGGWIYWPFLIQQTGRPWAEGFGPAVWIHAQAALPWVILIVGQGLRWVEPELEEDALLVCGPWTVLWKVTLPRAGGAIAAAAVWVMLQVSTELTVADLMLVRTFAEEVYAQFWQGGEEATLRALAVSLPMALLMASVVYLAATGVGRLLPSLNALMAEPRLFKLGPLRWPFLLAVLLGVGALAGIPAAALVRTAGMSGPSRGWSLATTLERLGRALQGNSLGPNGPQGDAILTVVSIGMAFLAGALAATLALIVCWLAVEGPRFRQVVFALVALAWALPGPIVGIGLKETILALVTRIHFEPLGVALYHGPSPLPILWAHLIRFLPCALVALWPVVRLVPRDLRDSVRLEGAGPLQELTILHVPLLWRTWLAVTMVMAALALSEIGAVAMRVETPGWQSFAAELFRRMHYGPAEDVATLCLLMVLMIACGGFLVRVVSVIQRALLSVRRCCAGRRDRFGKLHIAQTCCKICQLDGSAQADRRDEIGFHVPCARLFRGNLQFRQLGWFVGRSAAAPASAKDAVVHQVVVQGALAAVEVNAHLLANGSNAANVVSDAGPVFEHGQDLHAVGRTYLASDSALRIDAGRNERMNLSQHARRRRSPAQQRLVQNSK